MAKTHEITGILVNPDDGTATLATIPNDLDGYYDALNCSTIDIITRTIGSRPYDIICDDEGLLKDDPRISAAGPDWEPMLVGRLFVCRSNADGEMISLEPEDLSYVLEHVKYMRTSNHPEPGPMLYPVTY